MRLKKVKGAIDKVKASTYYVDTPEKNKGVWKKLFPNDNPIHIEIGMGKGRFLVNMAKKNPDINYIGIEMYRLTSPIFLEKYDKIFKNNKSIIMKTDNKDLFDYSVETLKENGYNLIHITNDLHSLNDQDNVLTEYEDKFSKKRNKNKST